MSISVTPTSQLSKELDYKPRKNLYTSQKLSKILPMSGQQTVTLTGTAQQETLFEIPTKVHNLANSYLNWTRGIAAQVAYSWTYQDTLGEIDRVQLLTRSGQYLCDISNFNTYLHLSSKLATTVESLLSRDDSSGLFPNNILPISNVNSVRPNNTPSVALGEPQYLKVSGNAAATSDLISFRLGAIPDTIFSLNKDLVFPEIIILRIVWNAAKVGFVGTSATDPTSVPGPLLGNITLSNIALFLAVETDPSVANQVTAQMQSGMEILIPFVHQYQNNLNSTSQTVSVKLTRSNGLTCRKILHGIYPGNPVNNNCFDHNNIVNASTAAKVTSYYTMLDNMRIQEINPNCTLNIGEDYLINKAALKNSAIMNQNIYSYNWVHIESFDGAPDAREKADDPLYNNVLVGIDLTTERKWDFYGAEMINASFTHFTFPICLRMLSIRPGQITVN